MLHTRHSPLDCYTVWDGDDVSRPTFSFNASENTQITSLPEQYKY